MYYTSSHEWIEVKGRIGTVGITTYAQKELGEVVSIELPKPDTSVRAKEEVCVLESTKAAADVYTPVSGKIIAVNEALKKDPSLLNDKAENFGWLFQIELSHPEELEHLLSAKAYNDLIG
jgi:glycine cleavage system H protein